MTKSINKNPNSYLRAVIAILVSLCTAGAAKDQREAHAPNIIVILADDMGYGDVQAFNPKSEIATPNLNRLADEGMRFTDAHTPSSVCTPTRYGLLTGRYCWRSALKKGVLKGYDLPLIEEDRLTLADYLKGKGYRTGIVGKWHLGLGFQKSPAGDSGNGVDFTKPLYSTPNNNGFDYSYILPASLDFEPYVYIRNHDVVDTNLERVPTTEFPHFWREGVKSKSLQFDQVVDDLLDEAEAFIKREAASEKPFFLYFPLTAPHKPVIPADRFVGKTDKGLYGDFIAQVDWTTGEILNLLDSLKIADDTLVLFTSDNGSAMYRKTSSAGPDHVTDQTLTFYHENNHQANGPLRGIKGDTWEGGHRVPFLARWPAQIPNGKEVDAAISLTDVYETLAHITGGEKPAGNAEDSNSFSDLLFGKKQTERRPAIIHHSGGKAMYAIRSGKWKLILGNGSGARTKPVGEAFQKPYQLYDLEADLAETNNLIDKNPEIAARLTSEFYRIKGSD